MLYCSWDMAWDRCNLYFSFSFYFSILLFWMSLGVCNHLNWPFDNGILKNVPLHLTFPFFHYAVFLTFKFLVVSDLCSETKGSQFESAARSVQRWALCSNALSLPLQSCNLWVYVKENPDRKKKRSYMFQWNRSLPYVHPSVTTFFHDWITSFFWCCTWW